MNNPTSLFIGDLHAMPSNLEDTGIILDLVGKIASENTSIDSIIFLGDVFHTHAVIRQEVAHFVRKKMNDIFYASKGVRIFILAGNHDGSSPHSVEINAIRMIFDADEYITVVDSEEYGYTHGPFFMVPFIGDNEKFIKTCQANPDKILVCHQTVKGAHFENKSLAPGGVDQDFLPQTRIISGHIHTEQIVGKTYYPGSPRAIISSEYNEDKGVFTYDHKINEWKKHSTNDLVKRFIRFDAHEGEIIPDIKKTWKPKDDVRLCVHGSEVFYKETLAKYEQFSGDIKFIPDIRKDLKKTINIDAEDNSVNKSLHKYVHEIYDVDQQMKEKVWTKLQTLIPNLGNINC